MKIHFLSLFILIWLLDSLFATDLMAATSIERCQSDQLKLQMKPLLLADDFDNDSSLDQYEVRKGIGEVCFDYPSGHLTYSPIGAPVAFSQGGSEFISFDSLGRSWFPSLLLSYPFQGDSWVVETKVTYSFPPKINGRNVTLWVIFGDIKERTVNNVAITRWRDLGTSDNLLTVSITENSNGVGESKQIKGIGNLDTFFFKIERTCRSVKVFYSSNGISYKLIKEHTFGSQIDRKVQRLIINGNAFAAGKSYAAFDFLCIRSSTSEPVSHPHIIKPEQVISKQSFRMRAKDLVANIKSGKRIELQNGVIDGDINLQDEEIKSPIVMRKVRFNGTVKVTGSEFLQNFTCRQCQFSTQTVFFNNQFDQGSDFSGSVFPNEVTFSGSTFKGLASFQGVKMTGTARLIDITFEADADFSGADFGGVCFFILSRFKQPVSFYGATFNKNCNFTNTIFSSDVSFADSIVKGDMTFHGAYIEGTTYFVSTLQGDAQFSGNLLDFRKTKLNQIIFSGGDPTPESEAPEFTGGMFIINNDITFQGATIKKAVFKDVKIRGLNLLEVKFEGPMYVSSNLEIGNLMLETWPSGKILPFRKAELEESMRRFIQHFKEEKKDPVNENRSYFEVMTERTRHRIGESLFGRWQEKFKLFFEIPRWFLLQLFWLTSDYGTSFFRITLTGVAFWIAFTVIYFKFYKINLFTKIKKQIEIRTRLSETPVLSYEEKPVTKDPDENPFKGYSKVKCFVILLLFSFYTFAKFGVGDIRIDVRKNVPLSLKRLVWTEWILGYTWYIFFIYTFSKSAPIFKGLFY